MLGPITFVLLIPSFEAGAPPWYVVATVAVVVAVPATFLVGRARRPRDQWRPIAVAVGIALAFVAAGVASVATESLIRELAKGF